MWKNNHFWPTTQKNGFKTLGRYTLSCRGRFDPRPVIGYFGPQWVGLSKFFFIRMFIGTFVTNALLTKFFLHAHSGLQKSGKQKTVDSPQIRSKPTVCWHSQMVRNFFSTLPPGTSGHLGLLKLSIKSTYLNFIN